MGVAGLYKWIVNRYPLIRHRINDLSHPRINHFFIDFNCIIYNSIQLVNPNSDDYTALFNEVCRYMDLLVQIIKPLSTIIIAVDGPAPFAKSAQQRSRRFLAAKSHVPGTFSTANISVGTEFMERLNQHLQDFIQKRIKEDSIWNFPKVIYSSHRVPCEAEHKFFNFIRENKNSFGKDDTFCVYSPDADLFFLTLQTGIKNFYIMREWLSWTGPNENTGNGKLDKYRNSTSDFELIHLPILWDYFKKQYSIEDNQVHRMIIDFIAISFLLGNDFIPNFPEIDIHTGDFDSILSAYQIAILDRHTHLITPEIEFDKENLKAFLNAVVAQVDKHYKSKSKKPQFMLSSVDGARDYLKHKYKERFDDDHQFEEKLCHHVIDSFNWVLHYYFKGCPSWSWSFPELYIPPISLVVNYIDGYDSKFELGEPPLPLLQLLTILPPQMASLLPESFSNLMFKPSPLASFYPADFTIDLNGKKHEHEGVILIPPINQKLARAETEKLLPLLTDDEKNRNTFEGLKIFKENANSFPPSHAQDPASFPSLYFGNIPFDCELKNIGINVFSYNNSKPFFATTLEIKPEFSKLPLKDIHEYTDIIGKLIMVDWPFLRPAIVKSLFNSQIIISKDEEGKFVETKASKEIENMAAIMRKVRGIDVNDTKIGIIVHPYVVKSIDGSIIRSIHTRMFPLELCHLSLSPLIMRRYANYIEFPKPAVGDTVILMTNGYKGHKAIIQEINDTNAKVQLINLNLLDTSFVAEDNYTITYDDIAEQTLVPVNVLTSLLSSLRVSGATDGEIGLPFINNHLVLDGYAQINKDSVKFNSAVLPIIQEYFKVSELQSVFAKASPNEKGKVLITAKAIGGNYNAKIQEIQQWIKNDPRFNDSFFIPKSQNMVSRTNTAKLQSRLSKHKYSETMGNVIEVPLTEIFQKGHQGVQNSAKPGDRIISTAPNGPVPFGTTGTVIGFDYEQFNLFVVADQPFQLGTNMRKRLTEQRGFVCNLHDAMLYE